MTFFSFFFAPVNNNSECLDCRRLAGPGVREGGRCEGSRDGDFILTKSVSYFSTERSSKVHH